MKQAKFRIIVIICYYGQFPWYFAFFLHSCKFNKSIDFLIVTDSNIEYELPRNVKLLKLSLLDVNKIATQSLGVDTKIEHPYKLCDFKPAYGLMFAEYITGYDFWGQTDIDVIYGNLRKFITTEMLAFYDFISVRHDYTSGCFALYRNNAFMNNIFKRSKDYKMVLSSSTHYCFDECNFKQQELTDGKSIFEVETEIESFTHIIKTAEMRGELKAHFDFLLIEGNPGKIKFDSGAIIYKRQYEAIMYHLFWFKNVYQGKNARNTANQFHISSSRIY